MIYLAWCSFKHMIRLFCSSVAGNKTSVSFHSSHHWFSSWKSILCTLVYVPNSATRNVIPTGIQLVLQCQVLAQAGICTIFFFFQEHSCPQVKKFGQKKNGGTRTRVIGIGIINVSIMTSDVVVKINAQRSDRCSLQAMTQCLYPTIFQTHCYC